MQTRLLFRHWRSPKWLMLERPSDADASSIFLYIRRLGSRGGRNPALCDLRPWLSLVIIRRTIGGLPDRG